LPLCGVSGATRPAYAFNPLTVCGDPVCRIGNALPSNVSRRFPATYKRSLFFRDQYTADLPPQCAEVERAGIEPEQRPPDAATSDQPSLEIIALAAFPLKSLRAYPLKVKPELQTRGWRFSGFTERLPLLESLVVPTWLEGGRLSPTWAYAPFRLARPNHGAGGLSIREASTATLRLRDSARPD